MKKPSKLHIDRDPLLKLIAEVGKPIERDSDKSRVKPVDLSEHANSLQELIEHAKGTYQAEVDRLKDRDDRKYARNYDDNFIGPDLPVDPANDYSEYMEEEPHKAWAEHFEQMYKLPRGNPNYRKNVSNTAGPRPTYFYPVYALIKWWWEKKVKIGEFKPDYNVMYGPLFYDDVRYDLRTANSAARLLYLIAKECDPGYTVENCANLPRVWRK